MDIETLVSAANRAQQVSDANIGNCSSIWHIGFFFDGVHRNIEQDAPEQRLSNISRLFRAYPSPQDSTEFEIYSAFYISGLGTPFHENAASVLHTVMDSAQGSVVDDLKDQPGDMAKDVGKELLQGTNWYEVLKSQATKLINPLEWQKLVIKTARSAIKKVTIEAVPRLRDNPTISDMLVTGVDTRIESTKITFKEAFSKARQQSKVPVKLISISLFGFDLGATLARKFIDDLLKDLCKKEGDKYTYQGVPVDVVFAGFFDCSRHTPASSKNGLGEFIKTFGGPVAPVGEFLAEKSIDQDAPLNPAIKKSLHLVAAHENRLWRSLYRLGKTAANWHEEVLPGCSEDVGGGLKPDEQKPSAELCRVALHRMYREARVAGVPFPDFQLLYKSNPVIAQYFVMQDNVKNSSVEQWVKRYQDAVPGKALSVTTLNNHMDSYINWLGIQYYQYLTEYQTHDDLRREEIASASAAAGLLGISPQASATGKNHLDKMAILKAHWGWLDDVRSAAILLTTSIDNDEADKRSQVLPDVYGPGYRRAQIFLAYAYAHAASLKKPIPLPDDYAPAEIFAYFVHDIQAVDRSAPITEEFFLIRLFDDMEC